MPLKAIHFFYSRISRRGLKAIIELNQKAQVSYMKRGDEASFKDSSEAIGII